MNSAWAPSRFTRWKARPRCQSDVCRSLMGPETNGRVRQRGGRSRTAPPRPAPHRTVMPVWLLLEGACQASP
ncbi:hypothetical protein ACE1SV_09530 [Streptomyces sp. E-15]